jgi:hypothetical protein
MCVFINTQVRNKTSNKRKKNSELEILSLISLFPPFFFTHKKKNVAIP